MHVFDELNFLISVESIGVPQLIVIMNFYTNHYQFIMSCESLTLPFLSMMRMVDARLGSLYAKLEAGGLVTDEK